MIEMCWQDFRPVFAALQHEIPKNSVNPGDTGSTGRQGRLFPDQRRRIRRAPASAL